MGLSPGEAAVLQMRADFMTDLRKFIKNQKTNAGESGGNLRREPVQGS